MQDAEFKMQTMQFALFLHFAFCILNYEYQRA